MFREQEADRKVTAKPQRSIPEALLLDRFQIDLQGSLASRLLRPSSHATERANVQALVNAWTDNWARMSGQTAGQAMPT
jgi:hypothetical protein